VALRAEAEALEAQLKTSMSTLASLRQELFETPTTTFSDDSRPVPFNELLQYAKTISSYTVPPTYREHIPKGNGEEDKDKDKDDATSVGLPSAGLNTPAIANAPSHLDEPMKDAPEGEDPDADKKEVTAEQAQWLTKMKENGWSWVPWPDDNKIRSGNLMQIQRLLDQDKDPWKERVPTPQELETQARDEQQQQQAVEKARPVQEPPMPIRRESILVSPTAPSQPAQFMGFDFDEEE
jgi:hypothetical protein